ncbi:hypothetical protein JCM12294_24410 [Desulfocicer niacini]
MCGESQFWNDVRSGKFASMVMEYSRGQQLSSAVEVYNAVKPLMAEHDDVESFYCVFLDAKNRVLGMEKLFSGTITSSRVYPRELVKRIFALKACAVVLAHNHPSGDTEPSPEDFEITKKIAITLHGLEVTVHDHIIVGNGHYSMAESGWLGTMQFEILEMTNR